MYIGHLYVRMVLNPKLNKLYYTSPAALLYLRSTEPTYGSDVHNYAFWRKESVLRKSSFLVVSVSEADRPSTNCNAASIRQIGPQPIRTQFP